MSAYQRRATPRRTPEPAASSATPATEAYPGAARDEAQWARQASERDEERAYRRQVAALPESEQAAEWVRLVTSQHLWLHEADERLGIAARWHLAWADADLPGVRAAIQTAHRHAREYALEVIDAYNAGAPHLRYIRQEHVGSLQWRTARGDDGEWLGKVRELLPGEEGQPVRIGAVNILVQVGGAEVVRPFREIVQTATMTEVTP